MVTYYQIVQAYRGVVTAARRLDYAKRFSSAQIPNFKPDTILLEGTHAPIEIGEALKVLHVSQSSCRPITIQTHGFRPMCATSSWSVLAKRRVRLSTL